MKQCEFGFMKDVPQEKSFAEVHKENQKKFENHRLAFARIFKRKIKDFEDRVLGVHIGFNIIKFDQEVVHAYDKDGVSLKGKLLEDFGQEAHDIIVDLTD